MSNFKKIFEETLNESSIKVYSRKLQKIMLLKTLKRKFDEEINYFLKWETTFKVEKIINDEEAVNDSVNLKKIIYCDGYLTEFSLANLKRNSYFIEAECIGKSKFIIDGIEENRKTFTDFNLKILNLKRILNLTFGGDNYSSGKFVLRFEEMYEFED